MPMYSIVIPVYNVERYLEACVASVVNQTFQDFEILLVDDGSTDGSPALCDSIAGCDSRIRVIHQSNLGLGGARNTGIAHAQGEFIWCVDSDDTVTSDALEKIDAALKASEADCAVFDIAVVDEADILMQTERGFVGDQHIFTLKEQPQMVFAPNAACNKVFRKTVYRDSRISYPEHRYYEDLATIPALYLTVKSFVYLPVPLYRYIQHAGSIMHRSDREVKRADDICFALDRVCSVYRETGMFENYYDELCMLTVHHVFYLQRVRFIKQQADTGLLQKLESYTKERFPDFRRNPYLHQLTAKEKLVFILLCTKNYPLLRRLFSSRG